MISLQKIKTVISYFIAVIIFLTLLKLNWIATMAFTIGLMIGQVGEKLKWWDIDKT